MYDVQIENWFGGEFLRLRGLQADSPEGALEQARGWVNRRAGFEFCLSLPPGTKVYAHDGDVPLLTVGAPTVARVKGK